MVISRFLGRNCARIRCCVDHWDFFPPQIPRYFDWRYYLFFFSLRELCGDSEVCTGLSIHAAGAPIPSYHTPNCLMFMASGNLWNTYYDFKHGLDKRDTADDRTLFDLSLTPNNVAHLSILAFIFALVFLSSFILLNVSLRMLLIFLSQISGAYLVLSLQEIRLFYLLLAGLVLTFFYTAGPIKLKYRALGDITIFLCFGMFSLYLIFLSPARPENYSLTFCRASHRRGDVLYTDAVVLSPTASLRHCCGAAGGGYFTRK